MAPATVRLNIRNTSGVHFDLFTGVGFHLASGMGGIKIHGAIHLLPLIIKLPEGLAGIRMLSRKTRQSKQFPRSPVHLMGGGPLGHYWKSPLASKESPALLRGSPSLLKGSP